MNLKTEEREGLGFTKVKGEHIAGTTLGFAKANLSFAKAKAFAEVKEDKANLRRVASLRRRILCLGEEHQAGA